MSAVASSKSPLVGPSIPPLSEVLFFFFSFFRFLDAAASSSACRSFATSSLLPFTGRVELYARLHSGHPLASVPPTERFVSARFDSTQPHGRIATNGTRPSATQCTIGQMKRAARRLEEATRSDVASPAIADAVAGAATPPRAASEGSGVSRTSNTQRSDVMCPKACKIKN